MILFVLFFIFKVSVIIIVIIVMLWFLTLKIQTDDGKTHILQYVMHLLSVTTICIIGYFIFIVFFT